MKKAKPKAKVVKFKGYTIRKQQDCDYREIVNINGEVVGGAPTQQGAMMVINFWADKPVGEVK